MKQFLKGLGVGLACLLCFVLGVVFNTQFLNLKTPGKATTSLSVSKDIFASKSLQTSEFQSFLNFFSNDANLTQNELNPTFKKDLQDQIMLVKTKIANSKLCVGGAGELQPNFTFDKGLRVQKGWIYEARYTCEFKNIKDYDDLLKGLETKSLQFSSSQVQNVLSLKTKEEAAKALQLELIKRASKEALEYSKALNKSCFVKDLVFNNFSPVLYRASKPVGDKKVFTQSARASFICE